MSILSFNNKTCIITGISNEYSIAWHVAELLSQLEAKIIVVCQNERLRANVEKLCKKINCTDIVMCDVSDTGSITSMFDEIKAKTQKNDCILHAIAFSKKEELQCSYINTSLENFLNTMNISCYSLTAITKHALPLMEESGGSICTLSYYGAEKVIPNYNVMGVAKAALECSVRYIASDIGKYNVRINAVSAGPVRTLASSGISDFSEMRNWVQSNSPLRRNVTHKEIANSVAYLLSDASSGTTGEIMYVDSGYNIIGMRAGDREKI